MKLNKSSFNQNLNEELISAQIKTTEISFCWNDNNVEKINLYLLENIENDLYWAFKDALRDNR